MFRRLRAYFFAGVLVTMPVAVTFAIAWWFIGWIDSKVIPLIPPKYNPILLIEQHFDITWGLPGFGLLFLIIVLTIIGALTAGFIGRWLIKLGDTLIGKMPILRVIYTGIKQILETVMRDQSKAFQRVVLLEYPRKGLWVIGFVTNEDSGIADMPEPRMAVFVPTTPNPTSGFVVYAREDETIASSMTVEEAIKLVISVGMITSSSED